MFLPYLYLDWTILLIIPGLIVAIWAQTQVRRAYHTYSKLNIASGITGSQAASRILFNSGIRDVHVIATLGVLSDNYNPRKKSVNLSKENYSGRSIAAVAVAAHETGHAMQHNEGYAALKLRTLLAPVVSAASYLLWPLLIVGIMAGFSQTIDIVVYIFVAVFIFQMITLPVEFNASRRAIIALEAENILTDDELYGARKMLRAAALTYVAATLVALLNAMRFLLISRRR